MAVEVLRTRSREISTRGGVLEYARYVFDVKGLAGGIDEEQVLAMARDSGNAKGSTPQERTRNTVPGDTDTPTASSTLNNPTFRVAIFPNMPGRARITVTWGRRFFSSGPATDPRSYYSISRTEIETIPYIAPSVDETGTQTVYEVLEKPIRRGVTYKTDRRLLPNELTADEVEQAHRDNQGKLYPDGVLDNVRIVPAGNQTQYYIETTWSRRGPVRGFAQSAIEFMSSPVAPLPENGVYVPPNPITDRSTGTQVRAATDEYEEGGSLPWLSG